jgi:hypothetical protein
LLSVYLSVENAGAAKYIIDKIPGIVTPIYKQELYNSARRLCRDLKDAIYKQRFGHHALNAAYLASKKRAGLDTRILIATRDYVRSIHVVKGTPIGQISKRNKKIGNVKKLLQETGKDFLGDNVAYIVTVPDGIHKPSGLPYAFLARILEFGSEKRNIPPRPHWLPIWKIFMSKDRKKLPSRVKRKFLKELDIAIQRSPKTTLRRKIF